MLDRVVQSQDEEVERPTCVLVHRQKSLVFLSATRVWGCSLPALFYLRPMLPVVHSLFLVLCALSVNAKSHPELSVALPSLRPS